jgi:hypothetical protein
VHQISAPLVPLGYGKFVRADRVFALVPLAGDQRGDGRRTLVHVEGIAEPMIASRSESAIARDIALALGHLEEPADAAAAATARRHAHDEHPGQEILF